MKQLTEALTSFVVEFDEGRETKDSLNRLRDQEAKCALMVRRLLGIDELSEESIRLFSKSDSLIELSEISPAELLAENHRDEDTV